MNLKEKEEEEETEEMGTIDVNNEDDIDWLQIRRKMVKEKDSDSETDEKDSEKDSQE